MASLPPPVVPGLVLSTLTQPGGSRPRLEDGVRTAFAAAYGARIRHLLPVLLGLTDEAGALLGVIGSQPGGQPGPMFLESYLDERIETVLARTAGVPVAREAIAEVGNLASLQPGAGLALVSTLAAYLEGAGAEWAVFTATAALRAVFAHRRIEMHDLARADGRRLGERLADWGRYYDTDPRVTAAHIGQLRRTLAEDGCLAARCGPLWDEALRHGRRDARGAAG